LEAAAVRHSVNVSEEVSQAYPVPETLDAINIHDGTSYEKKHFSISKN